MNPASPNVQETPCTKGNHRIYQAQVGENDFGKTDFIKTAASTLAASRLAIGDTPSEDRTYANDRIVFTLEGPAEMIGYNPFALIGGTRAIWILAKELAGTVRLKAKYPRLGSQTVNFTLRSTSDETV